VAEGQRTVTEVDGEVAAARVTLQTIANRVGVSRMTVSNAFSRPDQLSPALRDRILAAADELGYVGPDPTARALARGSTGAVGVLLTDSLETAFTDPVATRFLGAVAAGLHPTGLALTLLTTASGEIVPAKDIALDGAVIYSCIPRSSSIDWLQRRRLPLVFVDQSPPAGYPSVTIDDRAGAAAAARHLVELGHRRVALLAASALHPPGPVSDLADLQDSHVTKERLRGWLDELEPAGIRPSIMFQPPYQAGPEWARRLLDVDERPTAVLCFSDVIALDVLTVARELGVRVPEDLSVVGYDDAPFAAHVTPTLTTVAQDVDAKGRTAAALLVHEIAVRQGDLRDDPPPARNVVLPTRLVVRASTAPPPHG
jgi:DNA-binding LacI/PurR family transcriptional regulator